jgi:dTDP-4-dehydrorhamnose 3,5-epimerase
VLESAAVCIPAVRLLTPRRFEDERGAFCEVYRKDALERLGVLRECVQDNHSISRRAGTVRGLHYQIAPHAQDKLVRVVRGAILDVALDLRRASATFGQHVSFVLSAANGNQLLVPVGFAHGFCTLEPDTEVLYKVTAYYAPAHERGVLWNDPDLGIDWPVSPADALLSDKDQRLPRWRDVADFFP